MEASSSEYNTTIKNCEQILFIHPYYNARDVASLSCNTVTIVFMSICLFFNKNLRKRTDLRCGERNTKQKECPKYFCHTVRNIVLLLLLFFNFLNCIEVFVRWHYSSYCAMASNLVPLVPCVSLVSVILAIVIYEYFEKLTVSQVYLFLPIFHWCLTVIIAALNILYLFQQDVDFTAVAPSLILIIGSCAVFLIVIDFATVLKLVLKKRKRKRSLDINCPGNKTEEDFQKKRKKKTKVWFYPKKDSNKSHRIQIFSEAPHSGTDQYGVTFSPSGGDEIAKDDDKNYEDHRRNEDKLKYCHDVSFLSKYTYSWYVKILRRGWQRPLEFMDLGRVTDAFGCKKQFEIFEGNYNVKKNPEGENPSLWRVLFMTYRKRLFYAGLWKLFGDVLNVVGPVVILPIVNYVRQIQEGTLVLRGEFRNKIYYVGWMEFFENGWTLAFLAFVASILQSNFSQESARIGANEGIRAKTALQAKLFDKTLKMSVSGAKCFKENDNEASEDFADCVDAGNALNYVLKDTENIMMLFMHCHYIWAIPLKISFLIAILYMQMGISAVYGTVITVVTLIPLQFLLAKRMKIFNKLAENESDIRLKKTKEVIGFIKCLKAMALEEVFINKISDVREKEMHFLLIEGILKALLMFVTQASGIVIILLTFSFYNLIEGETPDEGIIFSSLALFSNLMVALFLFPVVVQHLIRAAVSIKRLQNYLSLPEVSLRTLTFSTEIPDKENLSKSDEPKDCVVVEKASFSYGITKEDQVVLTNISTSIEKGKVTMVLGSVGTGKSSFLLALLGEITKVTGTVQWNRDGNVAFVSQNPWLINASLRENILMGKRFISRKYNNVISLCALKQDIAILPDGDMTEIGKGGVGLSGGQKQRVALARALYSDHPFIFMDCPFSALDTAVAEEVFKNILDFHSRKNSSLTFVIATHHNRFFSWADKVIYLENKTIEFQGTPEAISRKYPHLLEKLNSLYLENMTLKSRSRVYNLLSQRNALNKYLNRIAHLTRKNSNYATAGDFMESFLTISKKRGMITSTFPLRASLLPSDEMEPFSSYSPWKSFSSIPKDSLFSTSLCENLDIETRRSSPFDRRHARSLPSRPRKLRISFKDSEKHEQEHRKPLRRKESFVTKLFPSASIKSKRSVKRPSNSRSNSKIWSFIWGKSSEIPEEQNESVDSNYDDEDFSDVGSDDSSEVFKSFIDDRDGKKGKISKWNYVVYLEACGWALGSIYIVFMIANQGALVALDLWLGRWSKMCQNSTCNVNKTTNCSEYEYQDMNKSNRIFFNLSSHDKYSSNACSHSDVEGITSYLSTFSLLACLAIFIGLFSILLNQFAAHKGRRVLHEKLLEAVVYARNRVFDSCNAFGRITIRFTSDVNTIDKELGWSIMHFTYFSLICLSAIVVNSIISPLFILLALPLCLIYYAIQHIFKCSSRELKRIELASQSPVASLVNEIAEYPPVIRAYGIQNKFFSCFCRRIDSYLSSYVLFHAGNRWLGISLDYLGSCIVFLATIACLIGSTVDLGLLLTPLTIGFAIKYTLSIPTYLNVLVRYLTYTENGLSSVERIQDYTNLKSEEAFEANVTDCRVCMGVCRCRRSRKRKQHSVLNYDKERFLPRILRDHLLFENVSLYYNDSNPVIKDISFSIPVKQKVGICGRTGSGKSSILSGILRMLERQEGTIFLSGMDTLKVPLTVLRKNISVVIQDVCVFEDTVRFNVDPENTHSDSEIWSALEKVHLKEMISNMPDKLESLIGAGNLTLSSGQAQLLVISRILLDKKNLLLLDEFGAHLDAETESRILVMIKEEFADSTVIMVTHNPTCLLSCDRILSVSEGRLVEDGHPKELAQKTDGVFSSLLKAANA